MLHLQEKKSSKFLFFWVERGLKYGACYLKKIRQ